MSRAPWLTPRPTPTRRTRRAAALLALALTASLAAACGEEENGVPEGALQGLEAVEISGQPGVSPKVEWQGEMVATELEVEVLEEGDGEELAQGDQAFAHLYLGNGFAQEQAFNTYSGQQPEILTVSDELTPAIAEAMAGQRVGTRVAAAAPPEEAFGEQGNPQLGIGNGDSVLFVVDILGKVREEVDGKKQKPGGPVPKLVRKDGTITKLEFPPKLQAKKNLQKRLLVKGDGEKVTKDSVVAVRYLGQVLGNKRPFDESYSAADPTVFGLDSVVKGWTRGLDGVPVGSRVVLVVPPSLGYGKQGQPGAGIKGDDTLVFVIDVLGTT